MLLVFNGARLHAADPCDPNRKFCGRLLIIVVSAGEAGTYRGGIKGLDDGLTDPASAYAYTSFHMFRRHEGLPGYSIVVTSDPKLATLLEQLPAKVKTDAGFLGTVPASLDAFQDLLSDNVDVSLLAKAIKNFSKESSCQSLIKSHGFDSVLPLLKTEIVIEGHNAETGVALWSSKSETGTQAEWLRKTDPSTLGKDLIAKLRTKLGGGVTQIFIEMCYGAQVGENFQTPDQCCAYLSVTDANTLFRAGGSKPGAFVGVLPDKGKSVRTLKGNSPGVRNITDFWGSLVFEL